MRRLRFFFRPSKCAAGGPIRGGLVFNRATAVGLLSTCVLAASISGQSAYAQTDFVGWKGGAAPKGITEDTYKPGETPAFGDNVKSPAGTGDDYDPRLDPNHPLKNPTKDPGAKWEGNQGSNLNNTQVDSGKGDIDWGEKYYEAAFVQPIRVTNRCKTPQPVGIFVNNLPLTLPPVHLAPPGESVVVGNVQLPAAPPPPFRTGAPGEPGWGHVDFGPIIFPAGMVPPPQIHQPNFGTVEGTVVLWHPWGPDCNGARITYSVTGHMHFKPPPPPGGGGGPERLATPDVCEVWWNLGEPPAQYKGEDCTEKFRELARRFNDKVLPPYIHNAPQKWDWLPTVPEVAVMTGPELLNMKAVAEAVLGHNPKDNKPQPRGWPPGKDFKPGSPVKDSGRGSGKDSGTASKSATPVNDPSFTAPGKASIPAAPRGDSKSTSPGSQTPGEKLRILREGKK
jgi:hypothetical protein